MNSNIADSSASYQLQKTVQNSVTSSAWTSRAGVMVSSNPLERLSKMNNSKALPHRNESSKTDGNLANILLSPEHFMTVSEESLANCTDSRNKVGQHNGNHTLQNLDISASQFNNVVNFDNFKMPEDQNTGESQDEEKKVKDGNKNLQKFKELKQWQMKQQEILLAQQRQQFQALREEQLKVQKILEKQKEVHDFHKPNHQQPLRDARNHLSTHTPPLTPGRPVPNLPSVPSTPSEYRRFGNPDLDSDTASTYTSTTNREQELDDIQPLPDEQCKTSDKASNEDDVDRLMYDHSSNQNFRNQNHSTAEVQVHISDSKHSNHPAEYAKKILNFDDIGTETGSQPDLGRLQLNGFNKQVLESSFQSNTDNGAGGDTGSLFSGTIPMKNPELKHNASDSLQAPMYGQTLPPGCVNILSMPAMLQNLPQEMLQQLIMMQQQGQTVVVDANGQMAIYPLHDQPHPSSGTVASNPVQQPNIQPSNTAAGRNLHKNKQQLNHNSNKKQNRAYEHEQQQYVNRTDSSPRANNHVSEQYPHQDSYYTQGKSDNSPVQQSSPPFNERNEAFYSEQNEAEDQDEDDDSLSEEEECQESEEEVEENETLKAEDFDNLPIGGIGAKKKTFEELLEEELQREEARLQNTDDIGQPPLLGAANTGKKTFLKRGQGTARFSGPPVKPVKRDRSKKSSSSILSSTAASRNNTRTSNATAKETQEKPPVPKSSRNKHPIGNLVLKPSPKKKLSAKASASALKNNKATSEKTKTDVQKKNIKEQELASALQPRDGSEESIISAGEISFQHRLQDIAKKEVVETEELEEFEILEQYADENASFLSSVSAVNRVLTQQKTLAHNGKQEIPEENEEDDTLNDLHSSDNEELQQSSQPIKSIKPSNRKQQLYSDINENERTETGVIEDSPVMDSTVNSTNPILAKLQSLKGIHRKVVKKASGETDRHVELSERDKNELESSVHLARVEQFSDSDSNVEEHLSNQQSKHCDHKSDSELSDSVAGASNHLSKHNRPVETTDFSMLRSNGVEFDGESKDDENLKEEQDDSEESFEHEEGKDDSKPGFCDMETWEDELNDEDDDWETQFMKSKRSKHKQGHSSDKPMKEKNEDIEPDTPPTSRLMSKLFPKLKPDKPKINKQQERKLQQAEQSVIGDGIQAKLLQEKLAQLEGEIERFRGENAMLEKLRKEREEGLEHLKKEMSEFQKQKDEELKRMQEFKLEETKKLKREKKLFEDYQKTMRAMPNKKEREEIETLKQQLTSLQDEMKRKEQRWTSSSTRLRDRIEQLEQENSELKDEVKTLEKMRLEAWQHRESNHPHHHQKSKSQELKSSHSSSNTATVLKSSASGPQVSSRITPQISSKLPQPQKQLVAKPMVQKEHDLRLSTAVDVMKISSDTMSEDSEIIQPEDSASNVLTSAVARLSKDSHRHSLSNEKNNNSKKSMTRKKAVALNISNVVEKGDGQYEEIQHPDGKVERIYTNGAREILFSNGTRKQVSSDGQSIIVSFFNGDIKQILPDQRVVYYYSDAQTTHTTYPDGLEILQFPNQQVEKHYPDGTKEITFPDQTIKYLFPNGIEESIFHDGTVIRVDQNGDKTMEFPNGQREIHTVQYKRREYPDGTVKTVFPDGRQETRYSSGRIRVKDKDGAIIVDRRM